MNIFGWTITRTSKKKEEEHELEIFEKCVDTLDKLTVVGKRKYSLNQTFMLFRVLQKFKNILKV